MLRYDCKYSFKILILVITLSKVKLCYLKNKMMLLSMTFLYCLVLKHSLSCLAVS